MNQDFEVLKPQAEQPTTEGIPRQAGEVAVSRAEIVLQDCTHPAEDNEKIILGYN